MFRSEIIRHTLTEIRQELCDMQRHRDREREREMCLTPESLVVSPLLFAALSRLLGDTVLATLQQ